MAPSRRRIFWTSKFRWVRKHFRPSRSRVGGIPQSTAKKVLVVGIIMADRKNLASKLVRDFASSKNHDVRQKWVSLFGAFDLPGDVDRAAVDVAELGAMPRSTLLNRLVGPEDLLAYDYVIVSDDDLRLPTDFLDDYIDVVECLGFSLSQPARTWYSHISHPITKRDRQCIARQTRFVEIGPLVCIRRDVFGLVFPFPEASGMGWGLDFVWANLLGAHGSKLGIIDALPIDHSIRGTGATYGRKAAKKEMIAFLARQPHLSGPESMRTIKRYDRRAWPASLTTPPPPE